MLAQSPVVNRQAALELPDSPGTVRNNSLEASSSSDNSTSSADDSLAEAPADAGGDKTQPTHPAGAPLPMASHVEKYIEPGQPAPHLMVGDKILIGLRDVASPYSAAGWVLSSGYSQVIDSTPNYGRNGKAYAQRLGASAARSSSEGIFSDAVLAPVLHEDPRYYKLGVGHSFAERSFYAISRTFVTRTDSGGSSINFSLLGGNLAGAALTQAYYPPRNRGFGQTMKTFGFSVGGSTFRLLVGEFIDEIFQDIHVEKPK